MLSKQDTQQVGLVSTCTPLLSPILDKQYNQQVSLVSTSNTTPFDNAEPGQDFKEGERYAIETNNNFDILAF